jgi:uncharacterized protein (DUF302 family)
MKENIVTERQSRYGFDKTIEMILSNAQKYEWTVPAVHDLQNSLAKSGKHVRPVKVIEICKPKYSGQMLELNDERIISVMMPCRISVYEKDDGKTYVGMLNARKMVSGLAVNIARVMTQASDETYEVAAIVT